MSRQKLLILIFAISFSTRLLYSILVVGIDRLPPKVMSDEPTYDNYALNILSGKGFSLVPENPFAPDPPPSSFRPPMYPLFLSGIYWTFGHSYPAVRIIQCIIGGLSCILIYYIGAKIFGGRIGKISAITAAFYPPLIYFSPLLMIESLFIFLLLLSIYLLLKVKENCSYVSMIFCGITLGLAALTRASALIFFPFVLLWILWTFKDSIKKVIFVATTILACSSVIIGAWTVRNYFVWHAFVPIALEGGETFWASNNLVTLNDPVHWGRHTYLQEPPIWDQMDGLSELERDRKGWQMGLTFLRNNPDKIPRLIWHKFLRFWNPFPNISKRDRIVLLLTYGILLPFMAYGLVLSLWRKEKPLILYFVILAFMLSALIFYGSGRMRALISPYLIMFASYGFDNLFQRGYRFLQPKS